MTVTDILPDAGELLIIFEPYAEAGKMKSVVPKEVRAAYTYIETDGAADFYVDENSVNCGVDSSGGEAVTDETTIAKSQQNMEENGAGDTVDSGLGK